ncbi:MAG: CinA family protein [Pseudomonadota bacterium]|nr:CinA family protein [Pseudomonadota bacterium]
MELLSVPTDAELYALAQEIAGEALQQRLLLVTAESCTGGWIAKALTDLPGSSAWFHAGVVTYSNEAKEVLLGVNPRTLAITGAVSEETALEMVSGALARFGAGLAVAVTGVAGPTGGTVEKPVGTVWVSWKRRGGYGHARMFRFSGDREAVRRQTVAAALAGLRKTLTE